MNRTGLKLTITMSVLLASAVAGADDGSRFYLEAGFGQAELESSKGEFPSTIRDIPELNSSFDTSNLYSGAVGMAGEKLRVELAYIQLRHKLDATGAAQAKSDDVEGSGPYLNVWYRFFPEGRWHPFIGAGLGYLDIEFDTAKESKLSLQGGVGLDYELTPGLNAGVRGQYISAGHTQFKKGAADEFTLDYDALSYGLSLRYEFGAKGPAAAEKPEPAVVVPTAVQ